MTTSIKPAHCKLCGEQHWSHEPHKIPASLQPRPWVKEFTNSQPAPAPVAKPVTAARDSEQPKKNPNICPGCDMPLPASRTKPRRYHDDACRMRASRKRTV